MTPEYFKLKHLYQNQSEWKLLRAEYAPLILSFLHYAFIEGKERIIAEPVLVSKLEDLIYSIREAESRNPENKDKKIYPKSARQYLDDWTESAKGWLRKFYQKGSDDAYYDLTPATERALRWVESLHDTSFIGTESRLLTLFDLLRQMVQGSEEDSEVRIAELESRKAGIEQQIAALKRGEMELMGDTAVRERFFQFSATARELLSDFRQVEHNFRMLDAQVREKIATWEGSKGELLDDIFGERDAITDSDQGLSFKAFWDFLMSPESQDEFSTMLEKVLELDAVKFLDSNDNSSHKSRLKNIHFDWLDAGEQTQKTVAQLSQQLRRFLDNKTYLENRRIMKLVESISRKAVRIKNAESEKRALPKNGSSFMKNFIMGVDESAPEIQFPLDRPLYSVKETLSFDSKIKKADPNISDASLLFHQVFVDKAVLKRNIRKCLQKQSQKADHSLNAQISLADVTRAFPVEKGLSEILAYLSIAENSANGMEEGAGSGVYCAIDENKTQKISWKSFDSSVAAKPDTPDGFQKDGVMKTMELPLILFSGA
jgi:hypothetical protein